MENGKFLNTCRHIIMGWNEDFKINSFVYIDRGNELEEDGANINYNDYEQGYFWARDWEASGADPNNIKIEYPCFSMQQMISHGTREVDGNTVHDWVLMLTDKVVISNPGKYDNVPFKVERNCQDNLFKVILRAKEYVQYNVANNSENFNVWLPEDQHEVLLSNFDNSWSKVPTDYLENYIKPNQILEFRSYGRGTKNLIRGRFTKLKVGDCVFRATNFLENDNVKVPLNYKDFVTYE